MTAKATKKKTTKKKPTAEEAFEPTRLALAVASLAACTLVLFALIGATL